MNAVSIFFIVVATAAICVILFQAYFIYENFDNIREFNSTYSSLEYSKSLNVLSVDRKIKDPNDTVFDVKQKWRCVKYNNSYTPVSIFGFKTTNKDSMYLLQDINDCIDFTFSASEFFVFNPCTSQPNSKECTFLKSMF